MSQQNYAENKNDGQFDIDSGTQYAWVPDENGKEIPVLILGGFGTNFQIWNGNCESYCDNHDVKWFKPEEHPFVQQLLETSHKLFKEKRDDINKLKSKMKKNMKKIQDANKELINSAFLFGDGRMKWQQIGKHGHTYSPVLVVQNMKNKPIIVLDLWGNYRRVQRKELVEFPLIADPKSVLSHFDQLKMSCARYAARLSEIEPGKTRCQWEEHGYIGMTNQCKGTIMHFTKVNKKHYTVAVKRDKKKGAYKFFHSNQIRIIKDETPGNDNKEEKLQNLEELTRHLEKLNSTLQMEKKQKEQAVEEIQKAKKLIDDQNKLLKKEKEVLDIKMSVLNREKSENEQLVTTLRERLIDTSVALDLSDGFPLVADIVKHYETIKTQFHHEASKAIKYSLKSNDKRLSKVQYLKCASQLLFDILLKSYNEMKMLEKRQLKKIADDEKINIENKTIPIKIQKQLRQSYQEVINQVKTDTADIISSQCIKQNQLDEILKQEARDAILSYTINCVEVCWEITLSRDPKLKIEPLKFETNEKITFDDNIHEAGPRSEVDECLNFIIWPAIYRTDTNQNLSLIIAVFLNHIPSCMKQNQLDELRHEESVDMDIEKDDNNNNDNENAPDAPIEIDYVQINSAANAQKYTV